MPTVSEVRIAPDSINAIILLVVPSINPHPLILLREAYANIAEAETLEASPSLARFFLFNGQNARTLYLSFLDLIKTLIIVPNPKPCNQRGRGREAGRCTVT